jgi:hypothetical protein
LPFYCCFIYRFIVAISFSSLLLHCLFVHLNHVFLRNLIAIRWQMISLYVIYYFIAILLIVLSLLYRLSVYCYIIYHFITSIAIWFIILLLLHHLLVYCYIIDYFIASIAISFIIHHFVAILFTISCVRCYGCFVHRFIAINLPFYRYIIFQFFFTTLLPSTTYQHHLILSHYHPFISSAILPFPCSLNLIQFPLFSPRLPRLAKRVSRLN